MAQTIGGVDSTGSHFGLFAAIIVASTHIMLYGSLNRFGPILLSKHPRSTIRRTLRHSRRHPLLPNQITLLAAETSRRQLLLILQPAHRLLLLLLRSHLHLQYLRLHLIILSPFGISWYHSRRTCHLLVLHQKKSR